MLSLSRMRAERSVIWFTGRKPSAKQRSVVGKFNELPTVPQVSALSYRRWDGRARQQRPRNVETDPSLESILPLRTASQKRNPIHGRAIAGSTVRTACLVDPQSNKCS
jgi:hypothetical protein